MKKHIIITAILIVINFQSLYPATLRGYLQGNNGYSYFPLQGARVDFWYWNGVQWIDALFTSSGYDGFYYFNNIIPGFTYSLQVKGKFYSIWVPPNVEFYDIYVIQP